MDWSKAKNIIIIVLVLTNLFLIFMYGGEYFSKKEDDSSVYEYTVNVLKEKGIELACDIPEETGKMHSLVVSYGMYDKKLVQSAIKTSETVPKKDRTDEGYIAAADRFAGKCGFINENTEVYSVKTEGGSAEVVYKNYYKGIPIDNCRMTVQFNDGRITGFERKWMDAVEESSARIEIMSPLSALLYFMSRDGLEDKTIIEDIYITYRIDDYNPSDDVLYDTALPAWCIKYNGGCEAYISAIVL